MATGEITAPGSTGIEEQNQPGQTTGGRSIPVDPDLEFIRALRRSGGESLKKCYQCGTCSASCPLSPDQHPFPRKEMAWALWGMKDQLMTDPDVWLCHHCNDCSTNCPRCGRPGDVLAAVREQTVQHYAFPRFLARWVTRPVFIPVLLAIPALLLGLALRFRDGIGNALGFAPPAGDEIVYSFMPALPHWLINCFFGFFGFLALVAAVIGVVRFAGGLKESSVWGENAQPVKGIVASIGSVLLRILVHDRFTKCETDHSRSISHFFVLFGFLSLSLVTIWIITGPINPLISSDFIYPFSFWSPWKLLANIGGLAVLTGCLLMIWERLYFGHLAGTSSYFDWLLVWSLFLVIVTGFATEVLHYLRMVPHRHIVYFIHLVFVFALLIYLPFSKLSHLLYRTTAMVMAERFGREAGGGDSV
ncbi:quinone-interacting membrane-bound oxidoreductase complex subunit QmoC [Candidatus Zixiibacteriota bacterium]